MVSSPSSLENHSTYLPPGSAEDAPALALTALHPAATHAPGYNPRPPVPSSQFPQSQPETTQPNPTRFDYSPEPAEHPAPHSLFHHHNSTYVTTTKGKPSISSSSLASAPALFQPSGVRKKQPAKRFSSLDKQNERAHRQQQRTPAPAPADTLSRALALAFPTFLSSENTVFQAVLLFAHRSLISFLFLLTSSRNCFRCAFLARF